MYIIIWLAGLAARANYLTYVFCWSPGVFAATRVIYIAVRWFMVRLNLPYVTQAHTWLRFNFLFINLLLFIHQYSSLIIFFGLCIPIQPMYLMYLFSAI